MSTTTEPKKKVPFVPASVGRGVVKFQCGCAYMLSLMGATINVCASHVGDHAAIEAEGKKVLDKHRA